MKLFTKIITTLSNVLRYIAITVMTLMMLYITVAVISRLLFTPLMGDIELVQLGMVVLIMLGLAYTQQIDGHISIEVISDRLSKRTNYYLDVMSSLLTFITTIIIAYIYFQVMNNHRTMMLLSTDLLGIPYWPFDFIIFLGFLLWSLESLLKIIRTINSLLDLKKSNVEN